MAAAAAAEEPIGREDPFTVGFTPSGSVTKFTFDTRTTLDFAGVETVPQPSTLALAAMGGVGLPGDRWRRRKRA
jgi:hypothetical protein